MFEVVVCAGRAVATHAQTLAQGRIRTLTGLCWSPIAGRDNTRAASGQRCRVSWRQASSARSEERNATTCCTRVLRTSMEMDTDTGGCAPSTRSVQLLTQDPRGLHFAGRPPRHCLTRPSLRQNAVERSPSRFSPIFQHLRRLIHPPGACHRGDAAVHNHKPGPLRPLPTLSSF
jgi:hypothetical protein